MKKNINELDGKEEDTAGYIMCMVWFRLIACVGCCRRFCFGADRAAVSDEIWAHAAAINRSSCYKGSRTIDCHRLAWHRMFQVQAVTLLVSQTPFVSETTTMAITHWNKKFPVRRIRSEFLCFFFLSLIVFALSLMVIQKSYVLCIRQSDGWQTGIQSDGPYWLMMKIISYAPWISN